MTSRGSTRIVGTRGPRHDVGRLSAPPFEARSASGPHRAAVRPRGASRAPLAILVLSLLAVTGACVPAERSAEVPGVSRPLFDYEPPEPGTYELPPVQEAADGEVVLAGTGTRTRLHELMGDRYVILAFVYTHCTADRGCPFALATFHRLREALDVDPALGAAVRLVTLSFDPARDDAERMKSYADNAGVGSLDASWVFLTTRGPGALEPILEGYGQYVVPEVDASGSYTGRLSHVLKVFLIDRDHRVRNVYSADFLHAELVLNDVRTLALEESPGSLAGEIAR